jgi:hypothetical protein
MISIGGHRLRIAAAILDPLYAPWHVEIDIDDPDVRAGLKDADRLIDAGCLDGNETRPFDHINDLDAEHRLILDDENRQRPDRL